MPEQKSNPEGGVEMPPWQRLMSRGDETWQLTRGTLDAADCRCNQGAGLVWRPPSATVFASHPSGLALGL
ncbi:MAG TPA: hypothetical protein GX715_13265 [Armatimonadetes bacterium]|jgi:hypothetical protein|nr:hypothetical protein [Armatimonadota bacterium]